MPMYSPTRIAFVWLLFVTPACTSRGGPGARNPSTVATAAAAETSLQVPRTVITPTRGASVRELFDEAASLLAAGQGAEAAAAFDRLVELDPDGELADQALFQGALAHEQAGDRLISAARFEQLARRFPESVLSRQALVRATRLFAYMEQWERTGAAADVLLKRHKKLTRIERLVAYGGKALSLVSSGDESSAQYFIEKGRHIIENARLDSAGKIPRDLAQIYYALGESRRIRGEAIDFDPMPEDFAKALEKRCQLLLDSQSAYSDTMRAYDSHWSAMAGFRVGELYTRLHHDVMKVPAPGSAATNKKAQLFEGAMRLRYSILLNKGLAMMTHTIGMAERTGENSEWVERSRQAKSAIERAVEAEKAAIDRLPYTRADLQRALDDIGEKARRAASKP